MVEQESLGKRFKRFLILVGLIVSLTTGVVIVERLSNDALALLLGLIAGVVVMIPCLFLLAFLWRRQERHAEVPERAPVTAAPPVVVVTPSMLPGAGAQYSAAWGGNPAAAWPVMQAERKFTIVGDES